MDHKLVLVFDLDNTLIQRNKAMLHCIEDQFARLLTSQQQLDISRADQEGYSDRLPFCEWVKHYLNLPQTAAEVWEKIRSNIGHHITIKESTLLHLKRLSQQHELAILSNGGTQNQLNKIKHAGLDLIIPLEKIFISETIGYSKPDLRAYRHVEQAFAKNKAFCMIGDHLENDILAAQQAGWKAILFSPKASENQEIKTIKSLSEL